MLEILEASIVFQIFSYPVEMQSWLACLFLFLISRSRGRGGQEKRKKKCDWWNSNNWHSWPYKIYTAFFSENFKSLHVSKISLASPFPFHSLDLSFEGWILLSRDSPFVHAKDASFDFIVSSAEEARDPFSAEVPCTLCHYPFSHLNVRYSILTRYSSPHCHRLSLERIIRQHDSGVFFNLLASKLFYSFEYSI